MGPSSLQAPLLSVVTFLGAAMLVLPTAEGNNGTMAFTGYLADMLCTRLEIAPDAANMILSPQDHTVMCELLPACLRSGYGILQNLGSNGESLFRVGAVLDEDSNNFVVDLLSSMDESIADLRVKVTGTFLDFASQATTPEIVSRDGEREWPAMNNVPTISLDALEFCNYEGPDARFPKKDTCTSQNVLSLLTSVEGRATLADSNLCMRDEVNIVAETDVFIIGHDGCADHATFQDVKRADEVNCGQASSESCEATDTCVAECLDACGNPLVLASGITASTCCLDVCENPLVDACGFPYADACGNPTLADGSACPTSNLAENQVNECLDACGSPIVDACGNPVLQCCLDGCGSPILDPCGFPWLDACGNPALSQAGDACPTLGANMCLPTVASNCVGIDDGSGGGTSNSTSCAIECVDACGNPLNLSSGRIATTCCKDACGNPVYDACGMPYLDACGNPTLADGSLCPDTSVAKNAINECVDQCGNPLTDACGSPIDHCCLDACGNPIVDACGFPYLDACGNPLADANATACLVTQLAKNGCTEEESTEANSTGTSRDRNLSKPTSQLKGRSSVTKGIRKLMIESHNKIQQARRLKRDSRRLEDECKGGCIDGCGNPLMDACGSPIESCCLDACGSPILDACGFPWVDACGNPASDAAGTSCASTNIGTSECSEEACSLSCVDACGNPLVVSSGAVAKSCCLDACGSPLLDGCGFPFYDACGNPTSGYSGEACPTSQIASNDINECVDGCGSPVTDACGSPVSQCCLDGCGSPLLDACGFPWLDACGNPALNANGDACTTIGKNVCLREQTEGGDSSVPLFPPAVNSFQCEGLASVCTVTSFNDTSSNNGIPSNFNVGRRRLGNKIIRRMQSEPSVPLYTPLKKDLRVTIPITHSGDMTSKELDPAHGGVIGVAVNGVLIVYEHPEEGANTFLFDSCGGHGDLANRYHYHLPPICLIRSLGGTVPRVSDWWLAPNAESQWPRVAKTPEMSPLIGWAIDGAPIFGPYNPDNGELVVAAGAAGSDAGCSFNVLDECNGMVLENGVYAYFLTPTAPFVPPCLMGDVLSEAFVDGGLLDGVATTCPFEGTDPLSGSVICDDKTIIFQDTTCPGNRDRLEIRNCFEAATSSFVGEPSCAQMEQALEESSSCFTNIGCCHDLEETVAAWISTYPALGSCELLYPSCAEFADNNVVTVEAQLGIALKSLVPDTRALLRSSFASTLDITPDRVSIDQVSGTDVTSTITFLVAYENSEKANEAANGDAIAMMSSALADASGLTVISLEASLLGVRGNDPTEGSSFAKAADQWSMRDKVGFGASVASVAVVLGMLVFFEDATNRGGHQLQAVPKDEPAV